MESIFGRALKDAFQIRLGMLTNKVTILSFRSSIVPENITIEFS